MDNCIRSVTRFVSCRLHDLNRRAESTYVFQCPNCLKCKTGHESRQLAGDVSGFDKGKKSSIRISRVFFLCTVSLSVSGFR
jgi:hypothetical protein